MPVAAEEGFEGAGDLVAQGVVANGCAETIFFSYSANGNDRVHKKLSLVNKVVGRWSLVVGPWSLVVGRWSLVLGRWSLVLSAWSLVVSSWSELSCP
jgi:hypothetical protein